MLDYSRLKARYRGTFSRYLERGESPGAFGIAVLCNDLRGALLRGDRESVADLEHLVRWLWNEAPANAWGSVDNVEAWIDKKRKKNEMRHRK